MCYVGTYATSPQVLSAVQHVNRPVLVLNLQPVAALDYEHTDTSEWLANFCSCCVPEMSLLPADVVVAGHICLNVLPTFHGQATKGITNRDVLTPGALVDVGPMALSTGDSVANTGLTLHRLGVRMRRVDKVGGDLFGHAIQELLFGVVAGLAEGLNRAPDDVSSYSVVFSTPTMDRIFLHCPGANHTFTAADIPTNRLQGGTYPPLWLPTLDAWLLH